MCERNMDTPVTEKKANELESDELHTAAYLTTLVVQS